MKAIFKSIFMLAATLSFVACSDVPSPYDIPGGNTTPTTTDSTTTDYINETFATSFGVFTAKTVKGTAWAIDYSTAKATGYDSKATTTTASDSYLVSAPVDLSKSTAANITFSYILRYYTKNGTVVPGVKNQVLITNNYTGDPSTTTWTDITGTLTEGTDWNTFSTYKANIPSTFIGKNNIVVALRYACESSSSTWEVKNFVMKEGSVDDTPVTPPTPTGDGAGTQASPYNVTKALSIINSKTYTSDKVYVSGTISKIDNVDISTYGNATYYISDDGGTTTQLEVYCGFGLGGNKFTSASDIKVGDKVIVYGVLTLYSTTPEITSGSQIYSLNGTTSGGNTGGTGTTGTDMTAEQIVNGKTSSVELSENTYNSQSTSDESTWYTWSFNNITYKGVKICKATSANGGGIQMQGNASDATKQGFLFNSTAYGSDIKTVTLTLKVVSTSTYTPSYSLYAGTAAHPTSNAITVSSTNTTDGSFKVYTETYDLSGGNYKYFTLSNDKVGAIYIDKIVVTLK